MKYAYIRVSSLEQNEARQVEAMKKYDIPAENYYIEKVSGKDTNRTELQKLLEVVQDGDTIHVHDFSRLSRSVADLLNLVDELKNRGVHLVSNKENLDTSTATGKLMLTMIGAINEFERQNMLERQREGIAIAVKEGKFRKKDYDLDKLQELKQEVDAGRMTAIAAATMLGISKQTWFKRVKAMG